MKPITLFLPALLGTVFLSSVTVAADDTVLKTGATDNTSLTTFMQENSSDPGNLSPTMNNDSAQTEENKGIMDKLFSSTKKMLSPVQQEIEPVKRSNASVFDIAGVMLRMNRQQVEETMQKRGYRRISANMEIPNFIRWRYEEICRNKNIVGYERLNNCVIKLARQNNYQFVENLIFNNYSSKETISVKFTSNFTGNKAYLIDYRSEAANVKGSGAKAEYLRNLKIFDFWKKINQKYGVPDNKEQVTWGLGLNKPILRAETGHLTLHDPMLLELDHARMAREDQKFMHTAIYTF